MKRINNYRILTRAFLLLILGGCAPHQDELQWIMPTHVLTTRPQIEEIWFWDNIDNNYPPYNLIGADSGLICFMGEFHGESYGINCMNGKTGDVIWTQDMNSSENIIVAPDGVYVGRNGGGGGVTKFDLMGNILWTNYIWGSGILYMYLIDNQVQVSGYPYKLLGIDASSGKEIIQYVKGEEAFISTPADTFLIDSSSKLKAVALESRKTIWETKIPGGVRAPPVFLEEVIILRSNNEIGSIYSIDRATGNILWISVEDDVISNIAFSRARNEIYFLTQDGKLVGADIASGSESTLVEFSATPFIMAGEEEGVGGYHVAFDDTTSILYVIIGDSRQLFAFKVK